ncbi:hypothetical protein ACP70R_000888 [Stipagrostis hirtigluma subsp. patula]
MTMKMVWDHARIMEGSRICRIFDDQQEEAAMAEDPEGHRCRRCGKPATGDTLPETAPGLDHGMHSGGSSAKLNLF